jgi:5-carboxymethyl-2-hydroxymuconate isomerase
MVLHVLHYVASTRCKHCKTLKPALSIVNSALSLFICIAMPHIILEHSTNIVEKPDFSALLSTMHKTLMDFGVFKLQDIKSRVYACDTYYIADGKADNAFVHVEVRILSGRNQEMRQQIADRFMTLLQDNFSDSMHERRCVLSVEVREMDRETYRKVISAHVSSSGM